MREHLISILNRAEHIIKERKEKEEGGGVGAGEAGGCFSEMKVGF